MSTDQPIFLTQLLKAKILMGKQDELSRAGETQVTIGRLCAEQFLDHVRAAGHGVDDLAIAVALAGGMGGEVIRGFLREIFEAAKRGAE